jgi:leucyl-tRNA synthetase
MGQDVDEAKYIEEKWQKQWTEARIFEAEPDSSMEKYFLNMPYPYVNGHLHLGHSFTYIRGEIMCRYKRMKGYNVLFPFAFHCTGTPIVAAANRVKENEPTQIESLRNMGLPEEEIPKFSDPVYWTEFFPNEMKADLQRLGLAIDWRRSFKTTSLNPYYDKFIRWQFKKLKEKDYVVLGEHPVVWCPKDNSPVSDHARIKGEGETPQEFTLLKFKFEDGYILAATLRPETVYGQTNMWVDPDVCYVKVSVKDETWIVSKECADKLKEQKEGLEVTGEIWGGQMMGKTCLAPGINREIIILPSEFCDPKKGTGLVTSVPSDAPDDWMGLYDLQKDDSLCNRWGLDCEEIKKIKPIPIINSPDRGDLPAVKICEEMGIESQNDREKLEEAKKIIYKSGFYTGIMNENCGEYAGMKVEEAKDLVKDKLIEQGEAVAMYELTGDVVCRCLTPSIIKVVSDQWFIAYGNPEWKAQTKKGLDNMRLYPETVRKQFEYVIDWLNDWACTREFGLGTQLPWAEKWVIESLSDSTIYMAYYILSKYLEHESLVSADVVNNAFFDYVFLCQGDPETLSNEMGISKDVLVTIKNDFEYWYPFDIRRSGKDLIQNHLAFCLYNHVAIFPERFWPRAFGVNGWILVDGAKMSKSAGNFFIIRDMLDRFGADVTRFTLAYGGEGIDDPNWDTAFAKGAAGRLSALRDLALGSYNKGREDTIGIDSWFRSVLNRTISEVSSAMEEMDFRTALKIGYFDMQRHLRWYMRRCLGETYKPLVNEFIVNQIKILAPFVPHICEEVWEKLGFDGFISEAAYPESDTKNTNPEIETSEELLINTISDVNEILKVTGITPERIVLYTPAQWKYDMHEMAVEMGMAGELNIGNLMKRAMTDDVIKKHSKEASSYAKTLIESLENRATTELERLGIDIDEKQYLTEAKDFLVQEFKCAVDVFSLDDGDLYDPKNRARNAIPLRPAIFVE